MLIAVFADAHAHADALDAVIAAADAERRRAAVVARRHDRPRSRPRARRGAHARALRGRADGQPRLRRDRLRRPAALRRAGLAGGALDRAGRRAAARDDLAWMRSRRPAARREGVQCWHGGPRNPVHEYVGPSNAAACLAVQRADLGLVGHTHVAAALRQTPRGARAAADPGRRAARPQRRQVAAQPGRRRRARAVAARLVGRPRRAGGEARAGWCSTSRGAWRPGGARRTTRRRHVSARARSASTTESGEARRNVNCGG